MPGHIPSPTRPERKWATWTFTTHSTRMIGLDLWLRAYNRGLRHLVKMLMVAMRMSKRVKTSNLLQHQPHHLAHFYTQRIECN